MFRKILYLFAIFSMLACSFVNRALGIDVPPSGADLDLEEQAVYLAAIIPGKIVVMSEKTSGGISPDDLQETMKYIREQMPGAPASVFENFAARNDQAYPLKPDLHLGFSYKLIGETEMNEFFSQTGGGWDEFYKRYPDSPGVTTVSRVGFNASLDKALVYVGRQVHWLAGTGYYIYLEKENGQWVIKQQVMAWIS